MGHLAMENNTQPSASAPPFHISSLLGLNSTTTTTTATTTAEGSVPAEARPPSSAEAPYTAVSAFPHLNTPVPAAVSVAVPFSSPTLPGYIVTTPATHLMLWANGYSVPVCAATPGVKRRRSRTVYSEEQLLFLEESFQRHHYLSTSERQSIAQKLRLSDKQVKTWFQNRRTKLRRSDASAVLDSRCVS